MNTIELKVKRVCDEATLPFYAHESDAGMDLKAVSVEYNDEMDCYIYHTGLAFKIPDGYMGLLYPRSSNRKTNAYLTNGTGVVDSGYTGEVLLCYKLRDCSKFIRNDDGTLAVNDLAPYKVGDKIGQLIVMPYPKVKIIEVGELEKTDRGDNGFGSSGN